MMRLATSTGGGLAAGHGTATVRRFLLILGAMLLALVACSSPREPSTAAAAEAPRHDPARSFSIHDLPSLWATQRGDQVHLADIPGRVQVMAMVYTSCHSTCPAIVREMKQLESALGDAARDDVHFVLVSLDPARDTPGRLAEWAAGTQLDSARWTLLAGDDDTLRELAAVLGVRYQLLQNGEVAHNNVITLLDSAGTVVHQRMSLGGPLDRLTAEIEKLVR
jgi:protein SCO1